MKQKRTVLLIMIAALSIPMAALGQDDTAADSVPPDEIVVVSKKSLAQLRKDTYEAEEDFYSVYNKLNDDKEYDVRCFYEKPTGTNIKNHVCRAQFVTKAFERHARRNRNNLSSVANQNADPVLEGKMQTFQEKMETLMAESPELQEAFARYNSARVQFFAKREAIAAN
ncbi:MAG: hypothetical protein ACR2Q3_15300 [Woeseiaceae bacterium]